jgi:hypothetical protein
MNESIPYVERLRAELVRAVARRRRRGSLGRRRLALVAAVVVGAATASLAAASLLDSEAPGPGIVERAVAAVTRDDVIYHVVERSHTRAPAYEPLDDFTTYIESWHTSDGRIHQRTFAAKGDRKGRLLEDWAGRRLPGRRVWPRLRWDVWTNTISEGGFGPGPDTGAPGLGFFGDPGARLRRLRAQGRLRVAGTTRVGQRRAYRLVSGPVPVEGGEERIEFMVDIDTYLPLAARYSSRTRSSDPEHPISRVLVVSRYLVYERLPLKAKNRTLLHLDPHPGAKCSQFAHELRGEQGVGFPNPCPPPDPE